VFDISDWDVSSVDDMNGMFYQTGRLNGDISKWDVSHMTTMLSMFRWETSFNSP
jgi:hypothetical protein